MVLDNRAFNEVERDPEKKDTNAVADVNDQIDHIDLEANAINNAKESGEINNAMDMRDAFSNIREEVQKSQTAAELSELFRQAGSLIKLLDTGPFKEKVGEEIGEIRGVAEEEFATTARELNRRGGEVGARAHYAEKWGD